MEQFVNQVIEKLSHKVPEADLIIIRSVLFFVGKDYEIKPVSTELAAIPEGLPQEAKEYLVTKKIEGLSEKTLKQYHDAIRRFFEKVRKPVVNVTTQDIRVYLYQISEQSKLSDTSLENQRMYICCFFKWLSLNGYILKDPGANVAPIKCEKKIREPLTDTEMEALRSVCETPNEKAVVETLYSTGCRVSELVNIKIKDIDFDKREVHVYGKGKKHRITYLNARAILCIRLMLGARPYDSEYLFENDRKPHGQLTARTIEAMVKRLGQDAKIPDKVFPHRIRHTTATDALKRGMAIEQVQQLLGHEEIGTTLEYAKVNREEVKEKHAKYIV